MSFRPGEWALLIDHKGRRYLVRLASGGTFHHHRGVLDHDRLIGSEPGQAYELAGGGAMRAFRPRLADYLLKMRRGATIVYPKDLGPILVWADVRPGLVVLEAGTGSGALAIALADAVGPTGRVVSVERREDHAAQARRAIEGWFGEVPVQLELRIGEVEDLVAETRPNRLILDIPEPWHAIDSWRDLPGDAIACAYLPTVPQVEILVDRLRATGAFGEIEVFETLHRTWNVDGRSVRPDHRMVGHTGFVTVARRIGSLSP